MNLKPLTLIAAISIVLSFTWTIGGMIIDGLGVRTLRYAFALVLRDLPLAAFLFVLWSKQKDEA